MKLWTQQLQEKIQRKALSSPATQINKAIANIQIEFVKQRNQIQNPKRRRERKKRMNQKLASEQAMVNIA